MLLASSDRFDIGPPPADLQRAALEWAFESIGVPQRGSLVEQTLTAAARGERSLDGLLAAWREHRVLGAVWSEIQPGDSAAVWPPQTSSEAPPALADELLERALDRLASKKVTMVQSLLLTDAGIDAARFRRAGFDHPCDLLYLASSRPQFPTAPSGADLQFAPIVPSALDELAGLIEKTYQQTLDCPALNGHQDCRQVVAGYRATCRDDLRNWFTVRHNDEAAGCLLLADHARSQSWELIYMGLVPVARGRGWGIELVRQAQWLVRQQGGERLLLAVDAANSPALRIYAAAGFMTCDRRSVFLKFLSRSTEDGPPGPSSRTVTA